MSYKKII